MTSSSAFHITWSPTLSCIRAAPSLGQGGVNIALEAKEGKQLRKSATGVNHVRSLFPTIVRDQQSAEKDKAARNGQQAAKRQATRTERCAKRSKKAAKADRGRCESLNVSNAKLWSNAQASGTAAMQVVMVQDHRPAVGMPGPLPQP